MYVGKPKVEKAALVFVSNTCNVNMNLYILDKFEICKSKKKKI